VTIQTFVTVHDQALIEECEADGRFAGLDWTYLFVGPRSVDRIDRAHVPVVVAREHADNIEHWPHLYDFTGWWVLANHDLIQTDRVIFLQYDMRPSVPDLEEQVAAALDGPELGPLPPELLGATIVKRPAPAMAAFTCGHRSANNWMLLLDGFEQAFRTGLEARYAPMPPADFEEWPSTQGTAWRTADFRRFMAWVRPMLDVWAGNQWAGHLAERSVYAWLRHTGASWASLPGVIHHDHGDCHGTCARMAGDLATADARASTFGR
jgi:hypothetical protein